MKADHATLLRPSFLFISTHSRLRLRPYGSLSFSIVVHLAMPTYTHSQPPHFRSSSLSHVTSRLSTVSTFNRAFFFGLIAAFANFLFLRDSEVTLEFRSVTASVVGTNSSLFGWIRLDVELNKELATFQVRDFLLLDLGSRLETQILGMRYVVEVPRIWKSLGWFSIDCGVTVSFIYGVEYLTGMVSFEIPRLICVSFGITRLICASFEITRLICASFGITRLMCKGMARGRPTRGKKDV
ncbi:hypothetical protein E5676_scaffold986G00220 [Cucumis melo var. makuwa]|uniref:Ty3-gypsy retrotransposon protein n=1 Tax=Cucumis melo var. makuwa TaxID=1194695 RepID=A0A5A7VB36_CUCMM|nr:hypothetical protein E6C27_scaffold357G00400 [Cucumis melo var. makuwa]TYJ96733.1 hypothetical protein E5676_scaffold986G00220 [Cucumis melo var. makuwa]